MDKDAASVTEINMRVASLIKFDDISATLVDVQPSRLASYLAGAGSEPLAANKRKQLETSFSLPLALSNALDKLAAPATSASTSASPLAPAGQATPSLGK